VSQLGPEQTGATPIYALTIRESRCWYARVDQVPVVRDPTRIYGSRQEIVELYAQLCPHAAQ
jgi:hypothetical protein